MYYIIVHSGCNRDEPIIIEATKDRIEATSCIEAINPNPLQLIDDEEDEDGDKYVNVTEENIRQFYDLVNVRFDRPVIYLIQRDELYSAKYAMDRVRELIV